MATPPAGAPRTKLQKLLGCPTKPFVRHGSGKHETGESALETKQSWPGQETMWPLLRFWSRQNGDTGTSRASRRATCRASCRATCRARCRPAPQAQHRPEQGFSYGEVLQVPCELVSMMSFFPYPCYFETVEVKLE